MGATLRTLGLFLVLTAILVGFGWVLGVVFFGNWVLFTALFLGFAIVANVVTYYFADRFVLWSYRAREVTEADAPALYRTVQRVAAISGLPMPRVAIIPSLTPNAFATGRDPHHAVVGVTEGILRTLDERGLTAVLAHELAHVRSRDILVMAIASTMAVALSALARAAYYGLWFGGPRSSRNAPGWIHLVALVGIIFVPIAALLIQFAISRGREFKADYEGAKALGAPSALADALETLETRNRNRPLEFGNPASSSLWIVNPFRSDFFGRIFSTHPPVEERVAKLRSLARGIDTY